MKGKDRYPRWGFLYALFGLMIVLFYLSSRLALTGVPRIVMQLGILGLVYFLTDLWIGSNMPFDHWS